jgi:hypothetical protein
MAVVAFAFAVPGSLRVTGLVVLGRLYFRIFVVCEKDGASQGKGGKYMACPASATVDLSPRVGL